MSESGKEKKVRIHKVALECNVSSDTLIEFLVQKGHTVKNLNSIVNDAKRVSNDLPRDSLITRNSDI